jgi:hypothetical protein
MEPFHAQLITKNSQASALAVRQSRQRTLHEKYDLSFNIEEMASAKSLVRGIHTWLVV